MNAVLISQAVKAKISLDRHRRKVAQLEGAIVRMKQAMTAEERNEYQKRIA